ncbi:hypothetical protein [Dactylosporangium salmoneum]|uniref:hypothetical protein n=1 Tax=Dactylosporangium salmoneum TaxID=53361 RepID=UPI0031D74B90
MPSTGGNAKVTIKATGVRIRARTRRRETVLTSRSAEFPVKTAAKRIRARSRGRETVLTNRSAKIPVETAAERIRARSRRRKTVLTNRSTKIPVETAAERIRARSQGREAVLVRGGGQVLVVQGGDRVSVRLGVVRAGALRQPPAQAGPHRAVAGAPAGRRDRGLAGRRADRGRQHRRLLARGGGERGVRGQGRAPRGLRGRLPREGARQRQRIGQLVARRQHEEALHDVEVDAVRLGRQPASRGLGHLVGVDQVEVLARRDRDDEILAHVAARGGDDQVPAHRAADRGQLLAPGVDLGGEAVHVLGAGDEEAATAQHLAGGVHRELAVGPDGGQEQGHAAAGGDQVGAAALAQREEAGARNGLQLLEAREVVVRLAPPTAPAHRVVDGHARHTTSVEQQRRKERPCQRYHESQIDPDEAQHVEEVEPAVRQAPARGRAPRDRPGDDGEDREEWETAQREYHHTGKGDDRRRAPDDAELLDAPTGHDQGGERRDGEQRAGDDACRAYRDPAAAFDAGGP